MKCMFAVVRSPIICLLAIMGGVTLASSTERVDPTEFVPLEVGNRWVYSHSYYNEMYFGWEEFWRYYGEPDEEAAYWEAYFKQFEVPGYPMGESHPPESLTRPDDATLVVEITHTEWIDGFEYFVFSEASYDWPPLPPFFWAGQKVRLSEDGILFFYRNGTHIPLYDFRRRGVKYYNTLTSATSFKYIYSDRAYLIAIEKWISNRLTEYSERVINPAYQDQVLEVGFRFSKEMTYTLTDWSVRFVRGYGIGRFERTKLGIYNTVPLHNSLSPLSAILSGKEVSYKEMADEFVLPLPELPPIVGQRDEIYNAMGFDFSERSRSDFFDEKEDDLKLYQDIFFEDSSANGPPYLMSYIGMADLGRVDFGRLVSAGPPTYGQIFLIVIKKVGFGRRFPKKVIPMRFGLKRGVLR